MLCYMGFRVNRTGPGFYPIRTVFQISQEYKPIGLLHKTEADLNRVFPIGPGQVFWIQFICPGLIQPWQSRANLVMASPNPTNAWLMDSGATHHLTSDLNNMTHQPYNGNDSVLIGDGSGLFITHCGSISLPSLTRNI